MWLTAPTRLLNLLAICFDCGDTLADEASEVKDARGATLRADLIPGFSSTRWSSYEFIDI